LRSSLFSKKSVSKGGENVRFPKNRSGKAASPTQTVGVKVRDILTGQREGNTGCGMINGTPGQRSEKGCTFKVSGTQSGEPKQYKQGRGGNRVSPKEKKGENRRERTWKESSDVLSDKGAPKGDEFSIGAPAM